MLMKKILLMMALAGASLLGRAEEMPEALYLCGSMNEWTVPSDEAGRGYMLTDPDGDGVYTGAFELPVGDLAFKVFTAAVGWEGIGCYFGMSGFDALPLYSNRLWNYFLVNAGNTGNVDVSNWKGGTLEVKAKYTPANGDYDATIDLTLVGPGQPALAPLPAKAYVIGDFNNWAVPTPTSSNGAYVLPQMANGYDRYYATDFTPAAGPFRFVYCTLSEEDGSPLFYGSNMPPFTLARYPQSPYAAADMYISSPEPCTRVEDAAPIEILNWNGSGTLDFEFFFDRMGADVIWQGCPTVEEEMPRYAIITVGDNAPYVYDMGADGSGFVDLRDTGREFSVLFSTENSVNPSAENVWGAPDAEVLENPEGVYSRIVKGGHPYIVKGKRNIDYCSINVRWNNKLVYVYATLTPSFEEADMVFINGYLVDGGFPTPIEKNKDLFADYQLTKTAHGIFEGTFYFPEAKIPEYDDQPKAQFRFFTGFRGWTSETSIGSFSEDFYCEMVEFDSNGEYTFPLVIHGLGNWGLGTWGEGGSWEGGWLKVTVNLIDNILTLKKAENGAVEGITDDTDAPARWYNLQGVEVQNPSNGLYIRKTSKGSTKVLVR